MEDNVIGIASGAPLRVVGGAQRSWWRMCLKGPKGALLPNLANGRGALRHDPEVRDVFAFDQMECAPVMVHEIGRIDDALGRLVTDTDLGDLKEWLQRAGLKGVAAEDVRMAVAMRARDNAYHPVVSWLRSLAWDGVKRIGTMLPRYFGAPLNEYTMHVGRMFMVQMVARVREPGCQADYMLVLEGKQGILKSTACGVLGGPWFSDHLPDLKASGKDASQHLRGKWLIEVAELHSFSRAEATQLKSFITRRQERYRPSYGRMEVIEPRQCVFVGTTNEDAYLRDPTGGRRFWTVPTGVDHAIDIKALEADRAQLFAEAVEGYRRGDQWWPDRSFEREIIEPEQAARYAGDIWEDKIVEFLAQRLVDVAARADQTGELPTVTVPEIAGPMCLDVPKAQQNVSTAMRIAGVLKERGWEPRKTTGGKRIWVPRR